MKLLVVSGARDKGGLIFDRSGNQQNVIWIAEIDIFANI